MDEVIQVGPAWVLAAAAVTLVLAAVAAGLDGVLAAREAGATVRGGLTAPVDEVARLLRQRRRRTVAADVLLWRSGGAGLLVVALLMIIVVPLGRWTLADMPIGIVWFNAMDVAVWAVVWLVGWGANSAHALVGGYRFLAQALGYELPLMFALTAPVIAAHSLRVGDVVLAQQGLWYAVWMPVAFVVFCLSVVAFSMWGPFSSAAGVDVAGGVFAELSGADRLLLLVGRYLLLTAGAAFAVTLFLGGGLGPVLPAWAWTVIKTLALLVVFVGARRRLAVLRPDRFAEIGWIVLLPLTLLQVLVVSIVVIVGS
ncbi:MAG: NADH-quinone oxidoreductase subunit H [Tomitella sp.]|nr:NADH-quinone oxidoreductase subunit H [Tomitella sp.]